MLVKNIFGNLYKGTVGKSLTAATWKGRNYIKQHFKPANPRTAKQTAVRGYFGGSVAAWQGFTTGRKLAYGWYERYRKLQISPFNAMVGSRTGLLSAGGTWTEPPAAALLVNDGANPIEGAYVVIKKQGQTTVYAYGYTDALGKIEWSVCTEDENYDLYITATGFEDFSLLDDDAIAMMTTHSMTGI